MNSSKQDILLNYIFFLHPSRQDFIRLFSALSQGFYISYWKWFISIEEISFHIDCSHEQFRMVYSVWNFSLHHPLHKDFIGIIPSSISGFLCFILVSIAEIIFHSHGIHEMFHIEHCFCNVSLPHLVSKGFIGLILPSIPAFLHFILLSNAEIIFHFHGSHEQFCMRYCVWNVSLLNPAHKRFYRPYSFLHSGFAAFHTGISCKNYF